MVYQALLHIDRDVYLCLLVSKSRWFYMVVRYYKIQGMKYGESFKTIKYLTLGTYWATPKIYPYDNILGNYESFLRGYPHETFLSPYDSYLKLDLD